MPLQCYKSLYLWTDGISLNGMLKLFSLHRYSFKNVSLEVISFLLSCALKFIMCKYSQ